MILMFLRKRYQVQVGGCDCRQITSNEGINPTHQQQPVQPEAG